MSMSTLGTIRNSGIFRPDAGDSQVREVAATGLQEGAYKALPVPVAAGNSGSGQASTIGGAPTVTLAGMSTTSKIMGAIAVLVLIAAAYFFFIKQ